MKRVYKTKTHKNKESQNNYLFSYNLSQFTTSVADKGKSDYVINKRLENNIYSSGSISTGTSTDVGLSFGQNKFAINKNEEPLDIFKNVQQFLETFPRNQQFNQVNEVINTINELLTGYQNINLPNFFISSAPDGSLGMSWQIADALLGISFEQDPNESSWFLLMGEDDDSFRAYGRLSKLDNEILLDSIINLLRKIQNKQNPKNG
jgi:hypothetical protein